MPACSTKKINSLIRQFRHGKLDLDLTSGNCGMFAYALARYLIDELKCDNQIAIGFVIGEPIEHLMDISESEMDVYHVALEVDGQWYDATGPIGDDDLAAYGEYYGDESPFLWTAQLTPESANLIRRTIEWETDWSCPWDLFADVLEGSGTLEDVQEQIEYSHESTAEDDEDEYDEEDEENEPIQHFIQQRLAQRRARALEDENEEE